MSGNDLSEFEREQIARLEHAIATALPGCPKCGGRGASSVFRYGRALVIPCPRCAMVNEQIDDMAGRLRALPDREREAQLAFAEQAVAKGMYPGVPGFYLDWPNSDLGTQVDLWRIIIARVRETPPSDDKDGGK